MDSRYLIVDKKILPEYFEKVVEASRLLAEGEAPDISCLLYTSPSPRD